MRTQWSSPDIWVRRRFERAASAPAVHDLQLRIHHDEDAEVYLNGQLIARCRGYTTGYELVPIEIRGQPLHDGENVLAVHCHQTGGGQYIDVGLSRLVEQAAQSTR